MTKRTSGDFKQVDPRVNIPALDTRILELWDDIDAFETSVLQRPADKEYTFYDGPPFATGSPHYGHILQGVVKDIVPRYWTMRGYRIERRFGWDTHGLPVEMEVEKELDVSGPRQIQAIGIDTFNEACRAMVNTSTADWEEITRRIGRWVDFDNAYKTMDADFMESVWWVFKQLWEKDLVYQAFKVLPYSWGATTPLSNFEANSNYKDVDDPSITVAVRILADKGPATAGDELLIWTTTPWTLPSNLAIAVGENITYARVDAEFDGRPGRYWLAAALAEQLFGEDTTAATTAVGSDLLGAEYEEIFPYFGEERDRGAFRVIAGEHVTTDEGTGLVHMAPAYGEDDFVSLQNAGLDVLVDPLDAEARFTDEVPDVAGVNVKQADAKLMELLKASGKLVRRRQVNHSYPFCWRTDTPLIYKAIPTWFVRVESFRDRMAQLNREIRWVPEAIGTKRFSNWLENARDWAISRNRYWGSCIPVWQCDNCTGTVCVGSRKELEELSGVWLDDLHKHFVDKVTFACSSCEGEMRRIPEVLDCWFESGSMPYAEIHYPFENKDRFDQRYPADFIAEGLDQTRGWFYTLMVLGTALFDRPPFENCVVTGLILAEDGRKMSKSLKNYPSPHGVLDDFGADALRAYLISSPVVRAETLNFSEEGVREVVRTVLLPLWNAFSFFSLYAQADGVTVKDLASAPLIAERPEIDRWIVSVLQSLIRDVNREMESYRLFGVVCPILDFIDDLTNWYIRLSRRRFWAHREASTESDKLAAFATLYEILVTFSQVAAPVLPFITEEIYQRLVVEPGSDGLRSIHLTDYPVAHEAIIDDALERAMADVRTVVNLGRGLRKRNEIKVRQPLSEVTIITRDATLRDEITSHAALIADELNVKSVSVDEHEEHLIHLSAKANFRVLGPRLGARMRRMAASIEALDHATLSDLLDGTTVVVDGEEIASGDVIVAREPRQGVVVAAEGSLSVALDCAITDELRSEGLAREVINRVQAARRDAGLEITDRIRLVWQSNDSELTNAITEHRSLIAGEVLATAVTPGEGDVSVDIGGARLSISVSVTD